MSRFVRRSKSKRNNPYVRSINLDKETAPIFDRLENSSETIRLFLRMKKMDLNPVQEAELLKLEIKSFQKERDHELSKVETYFEGQILIRNKKLKELLLEEEDRKANEALRIIEGKNAT